MAAFASLVVQSPVLAVPDQATQILPHAQATIARVDHASEADWEETHYLESCPGVAASIRAGLATPSSELSEVDIESLNPAGV